MSLVWRAVRVASLLLAVGIPMGLYIGGAQPIAVGLFPWPWSKVVHAVTFAVLAAAIGHASGQRGGRMAAIGFFGSVLVGALDEWHQAHLPGRNALLSDVGIDAVGAALGAIALRARHAAGSEVARH